MKTICLLESISRADGGIFEAELALQRELALYPGMQVDVVGLEDRYTDEDRSKWLPIISKSVQPKGPIALGYSPDLLSALDPKADLIYAAALWKYPSWAALQWAGKTGKPMIVAPHGSLDAWALKHSYWRKRAAALLFKNRQFNKASCLRALSKSEAVSIRAYGLKNPIAIVPNGIDLPLHDETRVAGRGLRAPKMLLFLGRIHPKKGLVNALRAFKKALDSHPSSLVSTPWQLVIAGWDQGGHEAELKKLCHELGLKSESRSRVEGAGRETLDAAVVFWGSVFGEEKETLLRSADAFILSSFSEGLPMSVLEAWSYRLPVLMTPECNLPEGFAAEAALRIETNAESTAKGINQLFAMSERDLSSMGRRGYELVKDRFTWQTVARQMKEVYDWVLIGGTPPLLVSMIE